LASVDMSGITYDKIGVPVSFNISSGSTPPCTVRVSGDPALWVGWFTTRSAQVTFVN
jgi:hypothetical protein